MGEFKIEKGIPVAPETRGRPRTYRFDKMEVGDSVLIQGTPGEIRSALASVYLYAKVHSLSTKWENGEHKILGRKVFTARKENEGTRIWRAKDREITEDELIPAAPGAKIRFLKD